MLIDDVESTALPPSLATLRWGLAMLFAGMMLTLGVTLSLAAPDGGFRSPTAGPVPAIAPVESARPS